MSPASLKTASGKKIRPAIVKGIASQVGKYDRALKLVEETERMVDSVPPPPMTNGKRQKKKGTEDVSG